MPSVATNGATLNFATSTPLISPSAPPSTIAISTAAGTFGYRVTPNMLIGTPRSRNPAITAVKPRIEPTERSIPPVSTTSS